MPLGYVYEIYDKRTEESIYVGTTNYNPLYRWAQHLMVVFRRNSRTRPVHKYMQAQGLDLIHFGFRVHEEVFWKTRLDLRKREQVWMDKLNPRCNVRSAYCTKEHRKKVKSACDMRWKTKKVLCECGSTIVQGYLWEHRKTAKHLALLLKAKHS